MLASRTHASQGSETCQNKLYYLVMLHDAHYSNSQTACHHTYITYTTLTLIPHPSSYSTTSPPPTAAQAPASESHPGTHSAPQASPAAESWHPRDYSQDCPTHRYPAATAPARPGNPPARSPACRAGSPGPCAAASDPCIRGGCDS